MSKRTMILEDMQKVEKYDVLGYRDSERDAIVMLLEKDESNLGAIVVVLWVRHDNADVKLDEGAVIRVNIDELYIESDLVIPNDYYVWRQVLKTGHIRDIPPSTLRILKPFVKALPALLQSAGIADQPVSINNLLKAQQAYFQYCLDNDYPRVMSLQATKDLALSDHYKNMLTAYLHEAVEAAAFLQDQDEQELELECFDMEGYLGKTMWDLIMSQPELILESSPWQKKYLEYQEANEILEIREEQTGGVK